MSYTSFFFFFAGVLLRLGFLVKKLVNFHEFF